jgi:hypothetical protein
MRIGARRYTVVGTKEIPMREMSKWHSVADICGWLSLFCWLPYLALALAGGLRVNLAAWMILPAIWMIYASPFAGIVLALVAASRRRWWFVLVGVWLVALALGWWYELRHPFDL